MFCMVSQSPPPGRMMPWRCGPSKRPPGRGVSLICLRVGSEGMEWDGSTGWQMKTNL